MLLLVAEDARSKAGSQQPAWLSRQSARPLTLGSWVRSPTVGVCSCLLCWILPPSFGQAKLHRKCCTAFRKCVHWSLSTKVQVQRSTCGLVAMTSASHAEGRQFDPGQVYALWRVREN